MRHPKVYPRKTRSERYGKYKGNRPLDTKKRGAYRKIALRIHAENRAREEFSPKTRKDKWPKPRWYRQISIKDATKGLKASGRIMGQELSRGNAVRIKEFGTFKIRRRKERVLTLRSPLFPSVSGQTFEIPAYNVVRFKFSPSLLKRIMKALNPEMDEVLPERKDINETQRET